MKSKKMLTMTLATAMVLGSSMTAFASATPAPTATPQTGNATGSGTAFDHVDKDIIAVTLPTVTNEFNYYVDPERLIDDAGTLQDGTTAVTPNADGVYFTNAVAAKDSSVISYSITGQGNDLKVTIPTTVAVATLYYLTSADDGVSANGWYDGPDDTATTVSGVSVLDSSDVPVATMVSQDTITVDPAVSAGSSYSSSSDAIPFEGKNSVDVEVSVKAEVTASAGGKDIALVADEKALDESATPALLMMLKVGTDTQAITSEGVTASATIGGVPSNFTVTTDNGKYVYEIRTPGAGDPALDEWKKTTVQLSGKTNEATVSADGMTAPQIKLTWTIAKSEGTKNYAGATAVSAASKSVTLTMPTGVTVSKVELVLNGTATTLTSGNHYTVSGNTLNVVKYAAGWAGGSIKVTYSDNHVDTLTCQ